MSGYVTTKRKNRSLIDEFVKNCLFCREILHKAQKQHKVGSLQAAFVEIPSRPVPSLAVAGRYKNQLNRACIFRREGDAGHGSETRFVIRAATGSARDIICEPIDNVARDGMHHSVRGGAGSCRG
jgi:hypothetical protein